LDADLEIDTFYRDADNQVKCAMSDTKLSEIEGYDCMAISPRSRQHAALQKLLQLHIYLATCLGTFRLNDSEGLKVGIYYVLKCTRVLKAAVWGRGWGKGMICICTTIFAGKMLHSLPAHTRTLTHSHIQYIQQGGALETSRE
jgi:hypothetical protein